MRGGLHARSHTPKRTHTTHTHTNTHTHKHTHARAGDLEPTTGESRRSNKLRIGRYNQHFVDALSMDVNPVEYLLS